MSAVALAETRLLIENVRWETYVALAEDRRGSVPRMTYASGNLELMSPRKEHETAKSLLGLLINAFCEEREIDILSVASTTFRRQDLDRGFEADQAYYLEHATAMRRKDEINLSIDPPPELVIEIQITSSAIAKLDLIAAMGVGELWRHDGRELRVHCLEGSGYRELRASRALPGFPCGLADDLLSKRFDEGETSLVRRFREYVRNMAN